MRNIIMLFSCFIAVLAVVFADMRPAFADHGVTAQEASDAQSLGDVEAERAMKDFLLNMNEHRERIEEDDGHSVFRNALRTDDGVWKSGTTYIITVNTKRRGLQGEIEAGEIVTFHAGHPAATDGSLRHIEIFEELMMKVEEAGGEAVCVKDKTGQHGNYICAVETTITNQQGGQRIYSVAGFDHGPDEVRFDIDCPDLGAGYFGGTGTRSLPNGEKEQFTRTSADMITDRESLVNYLKTVDEHITTQINNLREILPENLPEKQQLAAITARLTRLRPCWRDDDEPWKSGSIYFYLIRYVPGEDAATQYGIFNGLSPQFEDTTLLLYDGCVDVGQTVFRILEGNPDGFLEYYWSNPVKDDDIVVDESGNPIRGLSTGTSVKLGYFLTTNFGGNSQDNYVLGSGIYPDEEYYVPESGMCQPEPDYLSPTAIANLDQFPKFPGQEKVSPEQEKDDGGCAIASADQGNLKVAGFNLFLITAVMVFAVLRKSRSGGNS